MGNIIAVSGIAPIAPGGGTAYPGDLYRQALACVEIIKGAIEKAGGAPGGNDTPPAKGMG